jgi:hypothetical protein
METGKMHRIYAIIVIGGELIVIGTTVVLGVTLELMFLADSMTNWSSLLPSVIIPPFVYYILRNDFIPPFRRDWNAVRMSW